MTTTCPHCSAPNIIAGLRFSASKVEGDAKQQGVRCIGCDKWFTPKEPERLAEDRP